MRLSASVKRDASRHTIECYPKESCGFIVADGVKQKYIPCTNTSERNEHFTISGEEFAAIEEEHGPVLAVVHSHVNIPAEPSEADKVGCEASCLPWHIVAVWKEPEDDHPVIHGWHSMTPNGYEAPLVGRPFHHGSLDCYGLIRDFYKRELSIDLPDFRRDDNWWDDPNAGELYLDNFHMAGFEQAQDGPLYGDVILMQYRSDRVNHGAVFIGNRALKTQPDLHPVDCAILHHAMPMLSERVVYGGYWRDITRMIIRHGKIKDN